MTLCTCIMIFLLSAHSSSVVGYIMGYKVQCNVHLEIVMTAIVQVIGLTIDTW